MRLWSLHPRYLDRPGLTACWREALLAQAVLTGRTKGYRTHPQLQRFQASSAPLGAVASFLAGVADEADRRGYRFDRSRILEAPSGPPGSIDVTAGQLAYEWQHLARKLAVRSPDWLRGLGEVPEPEPHPLFRRTMGGVATWEVRSPGR
jgi:hypothetical protein